MPSIKNLFKRLSVKPAPNDATFDEIVRLLEHYGFKRRKSQGGSHFFYVNGKHNVRVGFAVQNGNRVIACYVENVIKGINRVIEMEAQK